MTEEDIIDILENVFIFKNTSDKFTDLDLNAIKGLLDLYQKQKEEIEELKLITREYDSYIGEKMPLNSKIIIADRDYFINGTFVDNYISKDKIRKEIEETEKELYNGEILQRFAYIKIETLKDLLKE